MAPIDWSLGLLLVAFVLCLSTNAQATTTKPRNYTSPKNTIRYLYAPNSTVVEISEPSGPSYIEDSEVGEETTTNQPIKTFPPFGSVASSSSVQTAGADQDLNHECLRTCTPSTMKKQCYYEFKVEWYVSMSKACYGCPHNASDCFRPHCVAADGHERPIVTVNRRMPGPSIQVCEGDEIIVDLVNELGSDTASIHWHGLHQKGTPFMDGVPLLTQCPIQPGTTFRYHFIADLPGTHYWHSHSGFQRTDGLFGSLIVRAKEDPHSNLYDVDKPLHVMVLTDWLEKLGIDKFVNHHHTEHDNKPYNVLLNGMGKFAQLKKGDNYSYAPIYEYAVRKGLRYRFRSVSNSIQNCPIEISVDNHTLLVIASDGHNIQPVEVESLVIYGGERWDFVVNANQPQGVYWVKFRGLLDCDERFKSAHQIAILRYGGAEGIPEPIQNVTFDSTRREGLQLNKLNAAPGDGDTFLTAADVRNLRDADVDAKYAAEPDHKFWLDFDFYSRDNDLFHHKDFYPFFGVEKGRRLYMPQINNISMRLPNVPPLSQPDEVDETLFCNQSSRRDCANDFCHCSHVINLELGSLVELILIDTGVVYWANHPFHLHGHAFVVLGMGRMGESTTLETIKELDTNGELARNFKKPPVKDTVTVPDGGYTVIRFIADNPGFWFFHCHISFHVEVGMGLVFHVGERSHLPPVPPQFPKCGSWKPKPVPDLRTQIDNWSNEVRLKLLSNQTENDYVPYEIPKPEADSSVALPSGVTRCSHTSSYTSILVLGLSLWMGNR